MMNRICPFHAHFDTTAMRGAVDIYQSGWKERKQPCSKHFCNNHHFSLMLRFFVFKEVRS